MFDQFLVRTPLFSLDFFNGLFDAERIDDEKLREVLTTDVVREAIYVGSPQLHSEIDRWLEGRVTSPKRVRKFKVSVCKYLARMSTRSTPFGLFAGFALGSFGKTSEVRLGLVQENRRHTRLDMNYLFALCHQVSSQEGLQSQLHYYPNSSIYTMGHQYRYVEYRYKKTRRTHHMVGIERSPYLEKILGKARQGATLNALANSIVEPDIPFEDARYFVDELVKCQLLVPELEPRITGEEFENEFIQRLSGFSKNGVAVAEKMASVLTAVKEDISRIEASGLGLSPEHYEQIGEKLQTLDTAFEKKHLLQTDLVKVQTRATLSKRVGYSALRALEVLNRLTSYRGRTNLLAFKQAFTNRYDDREVPLAEALDPEMGLGYPVGVDKSEFNPLIDDLRLPSTNNVRELRWSPVHRYLLEKYNREVILGKKKEIEIQADELDQFPLNWNDLPPTITAVISILRNRSDEHPRELMHMDYAGGASASYLMGRFCHADEQVHDFVREIIATEDELESEAITAEIVHLPEARTGNLPEAQFQTI
ncbi:MAG: lantibiotic dehydratase family protein [Bacteroidia bacterium]